MCVVLVLLAVGRRRRLSTTFRCRACSAAVCWIAIRVRADRYARAARAISQEATRARAIKLTRLNETITRSHQRAGAALAACGRAVLSSAMTLNDDDDGVVLEDNDEDDLVLEENDEDGVVLEDNEEDDNGVTLEMNEDEDEDGPELEENAEPNHASDDSWDDCDAPMVTAVATQLSPQASPRGLASRPSRTKGSR